jgi:hypothetical protein
MVYRLTALAREAGFKGLFAGLGPRMIMTAGLVSSQFLMYGAIKEGIYNVPYLCYSYSSISSSAGSSSRLGDSQGNRMTTEHLCGFRGFGTIVRFKFTDSQQIVNNSSSTQLVQFYLRNFFQSTAPRSPTRPEQSRRSVSRSGQESRDNIWGGQCLVILRANKN